MSDFRRPPTAQEAVLVELRARILRGELAAGTPLRQDDLAASLGVSRVPVREALRMLEAEGHVVYAAHRGYRVAELSAADLEEIYALRAVLEDDLAARSVATMTAEDLTRIRAAYAALADAESAQPVGSPPDAARPDGSPPDSARADSARPESAQPVGLEPEASLPDAPPGPSGLAAANRAFHWAILRPSPRADRILTTLWDASDAYRARWFADPANVARGAHDHRAILHAVESGDAPRLLAALAAHRDAAVAALRSALPH